MDTLIILFAAFIISLLVIRRTSGIFRYALAGRIAMAVMLIFTTIGHFAFAKGMSMMIPAKIPFALPIIYLTGVMEIAFAVGLLIPRLQFRTGWILIVFLILILPSNIYGTIHHINLQKADDSGHGPSYLWFRIPLQLFFIAWIYFYAIKRKNTITANRPTSNPPVIG